MSTGKHQGPKLVGETNTAKININGNTVNALLDTGSSVSVISKSFYEDTLKDIEIRPVS